MNYPSDYGRVAINLPRDEKKALIKYSENTGHTLTWVVRQALKTYVENNSEDTKTTRLRKGTK
jgi:predicted DNA-binding protein